MSASSLLSRLLDSARGAEAAYELAVEAEKVATRLFRARCRTFTTERDHRELDEARQETRRTGLAAGAAIDAVAAFDALTMSDVLAKTSFLLEHATFGQLFDEADSSVLELTVSIVRDLATTSGGAQAEPAPDSMRPDPVSQAIRDCRQAYEAYERACAGEPEGLDATPEINAASEAFNTSWRTVLATKPTTLDGARMLAALATRMSKEMGSYDYLVDAMELIGRRPGMVPVPCASDFVPGAMRALLDVEAARWADMGRVASINEHEPAFSAVMAAKPASVADVVAMIELFEAREIVNIDEPSAGHLAALFTSIKGFLAPAEVAS